MSCGCGCNTCGKERKPIPMSLMGLRGLGADGWFDESGIPMDPYPSTPVYTPAGSGGGSSPWPSLAASWSATAQAILKSVTGSNPTLVQQTPNSSTVYYGASAGMPSTLSTSLLSASSGNLWLLGAAALGLVLLMRKR